MLARLDHPNCVAVYSYLESASSAAIIMEYVEGVSLRTLTGQSPLSVEQALSVLEGALSGLAAAHQQGIVHGDIKPDNILLSISGKSKLVDFGLAAAVGTRRTPGTGSPTYSSPEAAAGEPLGVASDLYSVGLVLAELLAGVAPSVLIRPPLPPRPAAQSPPWSDRALDPDPLARQTSAHAFLEQTPRSRCEGCGEDWRPRGARSNRRRRRHRCGQCARCGQAGAATPPNEATSGFGTARRASKLGRLPPRASVGGRRHGRGCGRGRRGRRRGRGQWRREDTASSDADLHRQACHRVCHRAACHDGSTNRGRPPSPPASAPSAKPTRTHRRSP